jgi:hypothetical protein
MIDTRTPSFADRWRARTAWALAGLLALSVVALYGGIIEAGPLDPPGAPSSTDSVRLPGTPISSLPVNIGASGRYYVTRDLTFNGAGNPISINADDVELDLNGFTLHLNAGASVSVQAGRTRIRIGNGTMTGPLARINQGASGTTTQILIHDMTFTDIGAAGALTLQEHATIERVTVNRSAGVGISVGPNANLEDVLVEDAVGFGIDAGPNSAVQDCAVYRVNGGAAGQAALRVGDDSTIERCIVANNQSAGIRGGNGVIVLDSAAATNVAGDAIGINLGTSSAVRNSSARSSGSTGINIGNFGIVEDSTAILNGAHGIAVGARAIVRNSISERNTLDGIAASSSAGALIEGNVIVENGNDGIEAGTGARIVGNTLQFNGDATTGTGDGAAINLVSTVAFVEANLMVSNDIGILSATGNNTVIRNVARNNAGGNYSLQADDLNGVDITSANDDTDTHSHYNYSP